MNHYRNQKIPVPVGLFESKFRKKKTLNRNPRLIPKRKAGKKYRKKIFKELNFKQLCTIYIYIGRGQLPKIVSTLFTTESN